MSWARACETKHRYRFYENTPLWPFGWTMSYTSFSYELITSTDQRRLSFVLPTSSLASSMRLELLVSVTNTGNRAGAHPILLFVAPPEHHDWETSNRQGAIPDPPKRSLRALTKLWFQPGETQQVCFTLGVRDFAVIWDSSTKQLALPSDPRSSWTIEIGGPNPLRVPVDLIMLH